MTIRPGRPAEIVAGPPLEATAWFRYGQQEGAPKRVMIVTTLRGSGRENVVLSHARGLPAGSFTVTSADGAEVGAGALKHVRGFVGSLGTLWAVPKGLEAGEKLTFTLHGELGPFGKGFQGSVPFELGTPTPMLLVISEVEPDTQAARAGLRPGDVFVSYDGVRLENPVNDLQRAMKQAAGRRQVEVVVSRDGTEMTFGLRPGRIGVQTVLSMPTQ
jgi:membrane-associated protease RseP (regulator of RpoE activity)